MLEFIFNPVYLFYSDSVDFSPLDTTQLSISLCGKYRFSLNTVLVTTTTTSPNRVNYIGKILNFLQNVG